jgi:hypothetical protein
MILAGCAAVTLSASHPVSAGDAEKPHVVELFTSQSCYSCPPAEAYLGELAARDDIVALEYHVDYWDDLVYGSAGKWKDVFSDPAFTQRQRGYAGSIKGGRSYTPQMVIDGRVAAVGSRRGEVRSALSRADAHRKDHATVTVTSNGGTGAAVEVSGGSGVEADIWIVRYDLKHETRVRAGENKGKTLVNHNIVRAVDWIGKWNGGTGRYTVENLGLGDNTGCAVIVQAGDYGPIVGAAKCPAAPGA